MTKTLALVATLIFLGGCSLLPEKSPTKLEKSPCACGAATARHV
jgi:hypothetical protein